MPNRFCEVAGHYMCDWCSGNIPVFQTGVTGSIPASHSIVWHSRPRKYKKRLKIMFLKLVRMFFSAVRIASLYEADGNMEALKRRVFDLV